MSIAASDIVRRLGLVLEAQGYSLVVPPPVPGRLFATKRGHSLGPFLPYTDHIAVHILDDHTTAADFEALHAATREYSESQMRVPRLLRYRVPNAVTIGVTESSPSPDLAAAVERARQRSHLDGGAKDSTYLIDLLEGDFRGTAIEYSPTRYGGSTDMSVNPTNRVRRMMDELVPQLLRVHGGSAVQP